MARARGNAQKKKTRLTEQSLSAVMDVAPRREPRRGATAGGAAPDSADRATHESLSTTSTFDSVISSIVELLRTEPDVASMPPAYNDPDRVLTEAPHYPARRYVFGLVVCPECRNENIYYQDRDLLAAGYPFRCRICQHELLAMAPSGASD
ncbi:MAG: hypothetical protein LC769_07335 [Chloroflexi bacterium]|nr:hypothetical protein [Chloroflexota bacterium]